MIYLQVVSFLVVLFILRDVVKYKAYYTYRNMFFYAVMVFLLVVFEMFALSLNSFYEPFFRVALLPLLLYTLGVNYILIKSLHSKLVSRDYIIAFAPTIPISVLVFLDDKLNFFFSDMVLNANGSINQLAYGPGYYTFLVFVFFYGLIIAFEYFKIEAMLWKKLTAFLIGMVVPFLIGAVSAIIDLPEIISFGYVFHTIYFVFTYLFIIKNPRYLKYLDEDEKAILKSMGAYYVIANEDNIIEFVSFDKMISNPEESSDSLIGRNYVEVLAEEDFISSNVLKIGKNYYEMHSKILSTGKMLIYYRDFSDVKRNIDEREHLASVTDKLTGLLNRVAFETDFYNGRLSYSFTGIININDFSKLNSTYGHNIGNKFLQIQAKRLETEFSDYITYRLGADEFLIQSPLGIEFDPQDVIDVITKPVVIDGIDHKFGACMGVYDFKAHQLDDVNEYISLLDYALRIAKKKGRNAYTVVTDDHIERFRRRKELYLNLLTGLKKDNVVAVYQPYIDIETKKIIGFEGLARVLIYDRMFFPDEFIHLLEDSQKIKELDLIILEKCLEFARYLITNDLLASNFKISSNLSTLSMQHLSVDEVTFLTDKYSIPRGNIELEITEQTLIEKEGYQLAHDLKEAGYKIAIDDFSSGYASLRYLANMEADTMKIDRELAVDIDDADSNQAIIYKMILDLAEKMGLETVCEGVETIEQFDSLRAIGAKLVQGYFFSKPVSDQKFIELLEEFNKTPE